MLPRWLITRRAVKRLGILALLLAALAVWAYFVMIRMPGSSYRGPLPELTAAQRDLAAELRRDVDVLGGRIGARGVDSAQAALAEAERYLEGRLGDLGCAVERQVFPVRGVPCTNMWIEIPGRTAADEIVVVGAHYDTCWNSPGANDNGSGVAATLALARRFAAAPATRTLRFALFVNEEPPHFQGPNMGSLRYAARCRDRGDDIVAMLSLETIGYYSDAARSQQYPAGLGLLYPTTGNFIAFVGNVRSRRLVRACVGAFRAAARFPSEGGAVPGWLPGVGWSDHWAFWQAGYPAVMVTDTAPFRYPHYHDTTDTPDRLDYERMARVVEGLDGVVRSLADAERRPR